MRIKKSRVGAAIALASALFLVAGCASESGSVSPPSGDNGGSGTEPVKIGVITAVGSPVTNYPDIEAGGKAAVEAINAAGGINGAPLEMILCNTRGEANQAMNCARELDAEGVVATAGSIDIFRPQSFPILEAAGIPDIGSVSTGAEIDFLSPMSFPLHGGNFGAYTALPYAYKAAGATSMVSASIDLPIGILQLGFGDQVGEEIGLDVKPMIKVPAQGVTDYSPYVQQIIDSGADAATVALGPAQLQSFIKAADALGLDAILGATAFTMGQSEADGVGDLANTMLVTAPLPSVDERDIPGIAEYHKQLDAAGIEDNEALRRLAGLNTWLAVHAAAEVAKTIDGPVTRESMVEALQSTSGLDLFGLITYNPSTLATDTAGNAFPRFPAEPYHALTFESPKMVDADQPIIEDPLSVVR